MLGRLFGTSTTRETSTVPIPKPEEPRRVVSSCSGSLYRNPVESPTSQDCVYLSCELVLEETREPFDFELRIVPSDEDEPASSASADTTGLIFHVDPGAKFEADSQRITWLEAAGENRYTLDVEEATRAEEMRTALARALYEHRHSTPADAATDAELDAMFATPEVAKPSDLLRSAGELIRVSAELYHYDLELEEFSVMVPRVVVTINSAVSKAGDSDRAYLLIVFDAGSGKNILENEVSNAMSAQFYARTLSMVWVLSMTADAAASTSEGHFDPDTQICLSLKFANAEDFKQLQNQFAVSLYEVNNQATMESLKLKDDEKDYVVKSMQDEFEKMEIDGEDADDEEEEEHASRSLQEENAGRRVSLKPEDDGFTNSQLAISFNNDRTFVVRGDKLGVLSHEGSDGVEFKNTVRFKDPSRSGATFRPSQMLLHEKDTSMLLLDEADPTRVLKMDLERGQVVDTWDGELTAGTPMRQLQRTEKYSNLTHASEFIGLNQNQLLRMDPRTKEFIVQSKKYAAGTRARLEAVATTGAGHIAAASTNGDIRLFDAIGKNAKTHLPGLGDRIIGIDVTEDGNFVLATTEKYLLLIDTRVRGQEKGGFEKSMGKNKPQPIKLFIAPTDQAKHRMGDIKFTTAHFNTGYSLERSIVTSTGPFIVTWNFRQVKQGKKNAYQIKRYRDNVVADDFAYDNDGKIVVTLPNDVTLNSLTPRRRRTGASPAK